MNKQQHLRISHGFYALLIMGIMIGSLFVLNSPATYAATIEVHPGESIQSAINGAVSGDTVSVFSGTYPESIVMKDGVDVTGDSYARVILKGRVIFNDASCTLENISVVFPESTTLSYVNSYYTDFKMEADAGITAINSIPEIKNCVIKPDIEAINDLHPGDPSLDHYGKAIQIWNMYNNPDVSPWIEGNLIQNTDCGIYYFAQAFGGVISGDIKNNTLYNNKIGITLRMHKENPHIYNNIFDGCSDSAVFFTYEDNELFVQRKAGINNNLFYQNGKNFWLDSSESLFDLIGIQGNIEDDPLLIDPASDNFYLEAESPCLGMGQGGENIGSYPTDLEYPTLTNILPLENKFIGLSEINISGNVNDDNGILSVYINSEPAMVSGTTFSADSFSLDYGLNDINITAKDVAQKDTMVSKMIYNFRMPIAPPEE